jgi:hypothetical protein
MQAFHVMLQPDRTNFSHRNPNEDVTLALTWLKVLDKWTTGFRQQNEGTTYKDPAVKNSADWEFHIICL